MAKKKKIIKKTPTRVHSFRCTDKDWKELKKLAKECGISIGKYLVETGLKHHPRQRLTPEEAVERLIKHWYSIEDNLTSPVLTKVQEDE